jgi:mRNA interferase RelE/StbE
MGLFKIDLKGSIEHDLKKIDRQFIPRILEAIETLAENPFPVQSKRDTESRKQNKVMKSFS